MKPDNPDTQLFFDDFMRLPGVNGSLFKQLLEHSRAALEISPQGSSTRLYKDDIEVAEVKIDPNHTPAKVTIQFAGVSIETDLDEIEADLELEREARAADETSAF